MKRTTHNLLLTTSVAVIGSLFSANLSPIRAFNIRDAFFVSQPGATPFRNSLGSVITRLLPNIVVAAGIFFFFLIIYGGYELIIYGGKTNSSAAAEKGKNAITYGLIGLLLVAASYFILQIVSTITGIDFINSPIL